MVDMSRRGLNKTREKRYIEYNRDLDTELLEYEINFPPPLNNWELYTSDNDLATFILTMFDTVCHPREVKSTEVPTVFIIKDWKELTDKKKWTDFYNTNKDKPSLIDVCSLVNLQRSQWEK